MATERVGIHSFAELEASIGNAKTAADVKTAYESNANTNEFSDSEQTKLLGVEAGAEVNPTDAEIKTAYENNANTNAFTDAEQTKLSGISTGAEVNAVDSVFGRTGAVTAQSGDYTKSDVGLANVDNTSDADKPISTATQTALDAKQGDITLTTTGTSGAATLVGDTLNIPEYAGGGGGGVDTFNTLTGDVTISEGTNITFNTVGNDIEISASGGGGSGTVTEVTTNAPLSVTSGTTTPDLTITQATTSVDGYLTSTDWNTFNNKLSSVSGDALPVLSGNLDVNGNSIVSGAGGNISITPDTTGSVILDGISYPQADGTIDQVLKTDGAGQLSFTSQTSGTVTSVGGTGTVSGLTLTGTVTSSGNLTLGGSITGFLPLAGGVMSGAITGNQDITGKRPIVTDTTTNIDLTLGTHEGTFIYSDSALAVTVNIIANATQAFPVGTEIDIIQAGAGAVTITPAVGVVNLNGANTAIPITAQWGGATLKQITVDNWIIVGKI